MQRCGVPESLIGDLLERRHGRSILWLCRQSVVAIVATTHRSIADRPRAALIAAVASTGLLLLWIESTRTLYLWLSYRWMNDLANPGATWVDGVRVGGFWNRVLWVWWENYGGGLSLVWCTGAAVIGRQVVRKASAAFAFVAALSALPMAIWQSMPMWHPSYGINWVVVATFALIGVPVAMLLGGLPAACGSKVQGSRSPDDMRRS
jgi:hypothetical protein